MLFLLLETRVHELHFYRWQFGSLLILFFSWRTPKGASFRDLNTGAKTEFNQKRPFKVIQGRVFWGHWRAKEGLHITMYGDNVGFISKHSENTVV